MPELADGVGRAEYSGISAGTEMLAYRGEVDPQLPLDETLGAFAGSFRYPFAYGYSVVGRVERSRAPLAEGSQVFAFHPHQDVFAIAQEDVVALDGADARAAVMLPLVETALQVCLDVGPPFAEDVVVVGLGCVGILTGALLRRAGARVIASEPDAQRRAVAGRFGFTAVDPRDVDAAVVDGTGGRGASVVVEASGNPTALGPALALLAHEGTAVVCSWYGTKPVTLPLGGAFHRRRLTIRSSQVSTIPAHQLARWDRGRRRHAALGLMRELPLAALATHEFAFERAPEAYATVDAGEPGLIHAALRYG